jgi:type III pantothenate kinase
MNPESNYIFAVDVGNTHCHFGCLCGDTVLFSGRCETNDLNAHRNPFANFLSGLNLPPNTFLHTAYCSVVPSVNKALESHLKKLGPNCFHLQANNCPGLQITYPNPQEIGEDRLANALAAAALYGAPVVVIDMGTAVTFDIVTNRGGYEGGIIAPGIGLMTRYLHEQTALLPKLNPQDLVDLPGAIGQSTIEAMHLGCSVGFSGMLAALLERVETELARHGEQPVKVISTGGTMAFLSREWMRRTDFVEDLTLRGLAIAFMRSQGARD